MKKIYSGLFLFLACTIPFVASAEFDGVKGIIQAVGGIIADLLLIVAGLALLAFFWGLAKFINNAGDTKKIDEGKNIMKWGVVALFVMVSVWGIVRFFQESVGIGGGGVIQLETIETSTSQSTGRR